jgi:hypothetical protein
MTKDDLLGTWRVLSFRASTGEAVSHPLGERPDGYVGFDTERFWVMLVDSSRRPPAAAALTDAEAIALMRSCAAYTGKYKIDPTQTPEGMKMTVSVDAAGNQALVGTDRVFFLSKNDDRLIFKSPAVVTPNGSISVVHLEFAKAD